ncbi:hypothetical protein L2E82_28687 [Cichorium intybus]|uniref:Uncharacterized protein n=1 Tax=Cichorium intybus TaxID=13427 RepID=A0ACB9CWL7_CICIN|nr:hypothetical protein L2E82_28687 [Cichorium intybus]
MLVLASIADAKGGISASAMECLTAAATAEPYDIVSWLMVSLAEPYSSSNQISLVDLLLDTVPRKGSGKVEK